MNSLKCTRVKYNQNCRLPIYTILFDFLLPRIGRVPETRQPGSQAPLRNSLESVATKFSEPKEGEEKWWKQRIL